jgi:carboxylesterase
MNRNVFIRVLRCAAPVLAVALVAIAAANCATSYLVDRWDAQAPRHEETGILIGAEELDLGPADASTAVLLVHGFIGGSSNFGALPERLAEAGFRVRALRLPGHGTSPREFAETDGAALLEHVLGETRALAESHRMVIVAGHSMGGSLSALTASMEDEVDGLVLAAAYFGVTHKWYYVLRPETWTRLTGWAIEWVYKGEAFKRVKRIEARPEILSYKWVPSSGTRTLIRIGEQALDSETLGAIDCPVLMLHGIDDNAAAFGKAKRAFAAIGAEDKTFIALENSDHHVFFDYDREMVVERIVGFVQRISETAENLASP